MSDQLSLQHLKYAYSYSFIIFFLSILFLGEILRAIENLTLSVKYERPANVLVPEETFAGRTALNM